MFVLDRGSDHMNAVLHGQEIAADGGGRGDDCTEQPDFESAQIEHRWEGEGYVSIVAYSLLTRNRIHTFQQPKRTVLRTFRVVALRERENVGVEAWIVEL